MVEKSSDILNRAAEVILERGHCKRKREDLQGRVCLVGAVEVARHGHTAVVVRAASPYCDPALPWLGRAVGFRTYNSTPGNDAAAWNDQASTTEAMVLGALHDAALLAKEAGD